MQVYVFLEKWVQGTNQIYKNLLISDIWIFLMNKFHITFLFLYPLKASENRCFLMNFGGYRKRETSGMR